ncbi:hypothetical protein ACSYDW_05030 [Paeniglutamicibacter sp. R2-26]|uniref:hypothetical protein n=1 Tax=Paeniglutamicibacter sp. R2-26 TaxID=3144417 RepID=UPI003EE67D35
MRTPAASEILSIGNVTATITEHTLAGDPVATHFVVTVPNAVPPADRLGWAMWHLRRFLEDHAPAVVPAVRYYEIKPFSAAVSFIFS